jgi:hypothetical protein
VSGIIRRNNPKPPAQTWKTFIKNHMPDMVAVDFLVVPTIRFKMLFVFVVLSHARRRVVHFNVTANPTAQWTAQQITEAFPWEGAAEVVRRGIYSGIETRSSGIFFSNEFYRWGLRKC